MTAQSPGGKGFTPAEEACVPTAQTDGPAGQLPAPRLQLRWEKNTQPYGTHGSDGWLCHYELVLPLSEHDIRREVYEDGEQVGEISELVVPIKGPSWRGSDRAPTTWDDDRFHDTPYRAGAHSQWDAKALGSLPIFCIAADGRVFTEQDLADKLARSAGIDQ